MCATNSIKFRKKDLEKHSSISYGKPNEITRTSNCWNQFSQIYVNNVKQDFVACDCCKSVLIYKSTTGSGFLK